MGKVGKETLRGLLLRWQLRRVPVSLEFRPQLPSGLASSTLHPAPVTCPLSLAQQPRRCAVQQGGH